MKAIVRAMAAAALAACASVSASAQTAQPQQPPCSTSEFRQMDFWVGEWDGRWAASGNTPAGHAINTITREYGNCVIQEQFVDQSQGGLIGHSVSTYHAPSQLWRQTWVDNQGGYYALAGGRDGDRFVLIMRRMNTDRPAMRMVFEDITQNAFTWRWQSTADEGATWTDQWVIQYTRRR